jgi:hypothetical protein
MVAREIEKRLENFHQWSDIHSGFATSEELLASCRLDENGKVTTAEEMTNIIAESYAASAQIYLHCRVFR